MPNAFTTGLRGLLDTGMMGDIGTGLLSQSGWSPTPVTLGQAMGNTMQFVNSRQGQRLELEAARQKIQQQKDREAALKELPGLLSPQTAPWAGGLGPQTPINTPEGQSRALGLLTQIAPEQVASTIASGLLSPQDPARVSTDLNTFRELNPHIPRGSEEERTGFAEFIRAKNSLDPMTQLRIDEVNLGMERLRQQIEGERRNQNSKEVMRTTGFNQILRDLTEFRALNNELAGSFVEPGTVGQPARRTVQSIMKEVEDRFGKGSNEYENVLNMYDRASTLQQGIVNRLGLILEESGLARTDSGRAALAGEKPSLTLSVDANNRNIDSLIGYLTEIAGREGIYLDPSILGPSESEFTGPPQGNLDINSMSDEQLANYVRSLEEMVRRGGQ